MLQPHDHQRPLNTRESPWCSTVTPAPLLSAVSLIAPLVARQLGDGRPGITENLKEAFDLHDQNAAKR